jgi:hypothetical protein
MLRLSEMLRIEYECVRDKWVSSLSNQLIFGDYQFSPT